MTTCHQFAKAISLQASGCLPTAECSDLQRHLAACADCRARMEQLRSLCEVLASAATDQPELEASPRVHARVVQAVLEAQPPVRALRRLRWLLPLAGAAGIAAALALWHAPRQPPTPLEADVAQPTLLAYERATAESDAALDTLLTRHAASMSLGNDYMAVVSAFGPLRLSQL